MKAILTDEQALVYNSLEDQTISIATIHKGEVMDLGKVIRKKKKVWVEIALPGEQKGYIAGDTKIFAVRKAQLTSNTANLVDTPSKLAANVKTFTRGTILTISGVEKNDEGSWFKATDEAGVSGYVISDAKMKVVPESSRSGANRNMITGLIFIIVGIALAVMNGQSQQASGMVYIAYAVIFFGLLQGGQGVVEYLRVRKNTNPAKK